MGDRNGYQWSKYVFCSEIKRKIKEREPEGRKMAGHMRKLQNKGCLVGLWFGYKPSHSTQPTMSCLSLLI